MISSFEVFCGLGLPAGRAGWWRRLVALTRIMPDVNAVAVRDERFAAGTVD
jgi:hypothetical protein